MASASKPPAATSSFKPSFASIEQLGGPSASAGISERSPYRAQSSTPHLNTPSSVSSLSSTYNAAGANLSNAAKPYQKGANPSFDYQRPPLQPAASNNGFTYVSKYTQQLQQQQDPVESSTL